MEWVKVERYLCLNVEQCEITIEPRPHYCDRGNFIAKLFPAIGSKLALELDLQDGWPRYYFDLDRAKAEVEAWLVKRGLAPALDVEPLRQQEH